MMLTHCTDGEVHIHFAELDLAPQELAGLERLLSLEEQARAARLLNRTVRYRYIAGRGFLRRTLSRYLGTKPEQIKFLEGEQGKPYLADAAEHQRLRFNLSHKFNRAALAVTAGREVGIDLEQLRGHIPFRRMAERFFFTKETKQLLSLPPELQVEAFYRCWTRKEAYLKGLGTGLTRPANSFIVSLLPDQPPLLNDFQAHDKTTWHLYDVPVPEGYGAALALEGEMTAMTCFPWPPWTPGYPRCPA